MAGNLQVLLEDRPGTLAEVGEILGKAGVSIDGLCGFPSEGRGVLNILVEDPAAARRALEGSGVAVKGQREVLVLEVDDQPGEFGKLCRRISDAGVNIDLCYVASNSRLVLGADDLDKAREAAG